MGTPLEQIAVRHSLEPRRLRVRKKALFVQEAIEIVDGASVFPLGGGRFAVKKPLVGFLAFPLRLDLIFFGFLATFSRISNSRFLPVKSDR